MTARARKYHDSAFDEELTGRTPTHPNPIDAGNEELDNVFKEFPQNEACIELYRTTEKGGHPVFLEDITPSEFSFGSIAHEYGGGKYIAKGKYKGGEVMKRSFEIAGEPFPLKRKVPVSQSPTVSSSPVQQPSQPTVEIPRDQQGNPDMAALITGMMGMMRAMVQENKGSKAEWLAEMRAMRELFGAEQKPSTPLAEGISLIKTGIELGQTAGEGGGGFPWLLALDKLQGPLMELTTAIKTAVMPRSAVQPNLPPGTPLPAGQPEPQAQSQPEERPTTMEGILVSGLTAMVPMLVTGAAKSEEVEGGNVEFYCDFILDQIPGVYYATAKTWLEKPECLDQLEKVNAGVKVYRPWFVQLQAELLKGIYERMHDAGSVQPEPDRHAASERAADL